MKFATIRDGHYRLTATQHGIEFDVDRLRRERHELIAEVQVSCGILGAHAFDGVLTAGVVNLSKIGDRYRFAKHAEERSRTKDQGLDRIGMVDELAIQVLREERAGTPAVTLRDVPRGTPVDEIEIDGVPLLDRHPIILFGDGGTAKSYLALRWAGEMTRRGAARVLYADWELSAEEHRVRLEQLFGADEMPDVGYVRCARPMVVEADRLTRLVKEQGYGYLVVDSVAFACGGPPEDAQAATEYHRAVRLIGVGSLHVAHTNRSDKAEEKPFGSVFWHNQARATYYIKASENTVGTSVLTVGLFNKKSNLGPLRRPIGLEIAWEPDRIHVSRVDLAEIGDLADKMPVWMRLKRAVRVPQTLAALAEDLNASIDTLDRTVRRHPKLFTRVPGTDGVSRIALVESVERRAS